MQHSFETGTLTGFPLLEMATLSECHPPPRWRNLCQIMPPGLERTASCHMAWPLVLLNQSIKWFSRCCLLLFLQSVFPARPALSLWAFPWLHSNDLTNFLCSGPLGRDFSCELPHESLNLFQSVHWREGHATGGLVLWQKSPGLDTEVGAPVLALPIRSFVTLCKFINFFGLPFLHL